MPLENIPIVTVSAGAAVSPAPLDGLSGNAPVLLREIVEHVNRLLATGESSAIDLNALPLTPADLDWLRETLGTGEIAITLESDGDSTLNETACPGVWWVTHHNEHGAVASRFLEVAFVPELVKAHPEDIKIGLEHLELLISGLS
jgi:hydrogenase-1 operon protein HyaF